MCLACAAANAELYNSSSIYNNLSATLTLFDKSNQTLTSNTTYTPVTEDINIQDSRLTNRPIIQDETPDNSTANQLYGDAIVSNGSDMLENVSLEKNILPLLQTQVTLNKAYQSEKLHSFSTKGSLLDSTASKNNQPSSQKSENSKILTDKGNSLLNGEPTNEPDSGPTKPNNHLILLNLISKDAYENPILNTGSSTQNESSDHNADSIFQGFLHSIYGDNEITELNSQLTQLIDGWLIA